VREYPSTSRKGFKIAQLKNVEIVLALTIEAMNIINNPQGHVGAFSGLIEVYEYH